MMDCKSSINVNFKRRQYWKLVWAHRGYKEDTCIIQIKENDYRTKSQESIATRTTSSFMEVILVSSVWSHLPGSAVINLWGELVSATRRGRWFEYRGYTSWVITSWLNFTDRKCFGDTCKSLCEHILLSVISPKSRTIIKLFIFQTNGSTTYYTRNKNNLLELEHLHHIIKHFSGCAIDGEM